MNQWISIYETDLEFKAEMVKDILANNGIESVLLSHKGSAFRLGEIRVMVAPEDSEKAEEIVKNIK